MYLMSQEVDPARLFERVLEMSSWLGEGMRSDAAGRGLTVVRAEVLWVLARDGPLRQTDLAKSLRVTPHNVTVLIDALEGAGLVRRAPDPRDRRAILLELTDTGQATAHTLVAEQRRTAQLLFAGMSPGALKTFQSAVDLIVDRLRGPEFAAIRRAALDRWSALQRERAGDGGTPAPRLLPRRGDHGDRPRGADVAPGHPPGGTRAR